MLFQAPNFIPAIPEIFLFAMTMIVLLVELFQGDKYKSLGYYLTQLSLVGALVLAIDTYHFETVITFHGNYILDHAACIIKIFIYALSIFVLLYSKDYIVENQFPKTEYYVLTLIVVLGMSVLVSAYSFITIYLGLELLSLPLYAMIAFKRQSAICSEAAMKYFIMGAIASGMLLYGMSMLYGATDGLAIDTVVQKINSAGLSSNLMMMFGVVFIIAGVMFKLGAVPFHMWVPDVYDGAPNSVTLFIASAVKLAGFALAMRLLIDSLDMFHPAWQHVLIAISILSMALGNLVAIVQTNIKRMLAYSSIAHMGYMLLGFISGAMFGYGAALFYMIAYAVMSLGAFGVLTVLSKAGYEIENISDLKGLNSRNSWLAFLMLLIMFSMAGIPPSVGFFAKIAVLESLVGAHLVWLAALALIFAIVGAYYYIRVVKTMYFDEPDETSAWILAGRVKNIALGVNCLAVLILGILPTGLFNLCIHAFLNMR